MASKVLMTSGIHWGLSCEAQDEAQMGVILGYMTLLGAKNIAWAPLNRPPKRRAADPDAPKNPNMATGAAKAAATRKKNSGDRRKPAEAVGAEFLASHHGDFTASQINAAFEKAGYASTRAYSLLNRWIKAGTVKRAGKGEYSNLTGRKTAAAS
jgi:transcription elongation factor